MDFLVWFSYDVCVEKLLETKTRQSSTSENVISLSATVGDAAGLDGVVGFDGVESVVESVSGSGSGGGVIGAVYVPGVIT